MIHAKAWLIPVFLFIAFLEFWISQRQGKPYFSKANTAMNLTIGAIDQIVSLLGFYLLFLALEFVYEYFRLFDWENTWLQWVLAYLAVDFVSYWYHRYSHEINILWAGHITHHSSNYFNFTNGFRTSPFQGLNRIPFWLVLPVLGFSPFVLVFTLKISGLFDFLQHTQWVPSLGFIEKIFITPSLHRVHHGKNDLYLDKNFGSTFSFWDRLFGTYQEETEPVVYGLTNSGYEDRNPWSAIFYQYQLIWDNVKTSSGWKAKLSYLFFAPSWIAKNPMEVRKSGSGLALNNRTGSFFYCWMQMAGGAVSVILLLAFQDSLPGWVFLSVALLSITGMVLATQSLHRSTPSSFRNKEQIRLALTAIPGMWMFETDPNLLSLALLLFLMVSFFLTLSMKGLVDKAGGFDSLS
jgi:alkylglycerol monooxygenase